MLQHILNVSVTDLKKNYANLNVSFDLWKGESDAQAYIPAMVERLKAEGFAYESEGALVVDVKEETDTKEIPPCMIQKSDKGRQFRKYFIACEEQLKNNNVLSEKQQCILSIYEGVAEAV